MSSVAPLVAPTVAAGTGLVDARALDAAFAAIQAKINELIAAINRWTDGTNQVADAQVRLRMLAATTVQSITDAVAAIASLREQIGDGIDTTQQRTNNRPLPSGYIRVQTGVPSGRNDLSDSIRGGRSFDRRPVIIVPGEAGRLYRVRMWVRHNMEGTFFGDKYTGGPDDPHYPNTLAANETHRYLTIPSRRRASPTPVGIPFPGEVNAPRVTDCVHLSRLRLTFSPLREIWSASFNNGLHIKADNPFRMWVLNGCLSKGGHPGGSYPGDWQEQFPFREDDYANWPVTTTKPLSIFLDIPCRAGSTFTLHYNAGRSNPGGGYASIRTDDYPTDEGRPAFPYRYAFRAGGGVQWDVAGWWPMDENGGPTVDDEYGVPISSVGPGGILTP